jgi:hypothetical protein
VTTRTAATLSALLAGGLLALPLSAAAAPAARPAPAPVTARRAATVTLITGDHVRVDTVNGKQRIETQPASSRVPLTTSRAGKDVYVVPAQVRPYLGRFIDRRLFDVTRLSAAARADGRVRVRISYTGSARPSVPGVTITSASDGSASGYVTHTSAPAFGRALTAQFKADAKAGFPARTTLFPGVTKVAADLPGGRPVTPKFPMYTLKLTGTDADGAAPQNATGFLLNVDDGRKFAGFVDFYQGQARASVPAGTYSLILDAFDYNEATDTFTDRLVTTSQYVVKGADQTLNSDFGKASQRAGQVVTPQPATVDDYTFEWDRADAGEYSGISWGAGAGPNAKLYIAPSGKAKVGSLHVLQTWQASQPGTKKTYAYTLASSTSRIPKVLTKTFAAADLATRRSAYYTDGPTREAAMLRFPVYPWQFFVGGSYTSLTTPVSRTEYVGSNGKPLWGEGYVADNNVYDDPGFWDSNYWRTLPAGSTTRTAWARGPIAPGVPVQKMPDSNYCWQCRTSRVLSTALAPGLDSTADHAAEIFGAEDGLPVTRFRFYKNNKLVSDDDDYLGGLFDVPTAKTKYRAVLDVDRRLTGQVQSTRSHTEYRFTSAAGQGRKLPANWYCDAGDSGCRVLPVVTAKVALPTTLNGRLPAGKSTVTVSASRIQKASAGTITKAGLEIRVPGYGWVTVPLKKSANGVYRGEVDNTDFAGADVDVHVTAADSAGNAFDQTVLKAYTVAGS